MTATRPEEEAFKLPSRRAPDMVLTDNEAAWITFIRIISNDTDPGPTLKRIQALRMILE